MKYSPLEKRLIQALMDVYEVIEVPTKDMSIARGEKMRNDAMDIMHPILVEHQNAVRQ